MHITASLGAELPAITLAWMAVASPELGVWLSVDAQRIATGW